MNRVSLRTVGLIALLLSSVSLTRADDLSSIADQIATKLRNAHKQAMFPRVVVNSFSTAAGGISQLTETLSTEFSEQLSGKLGTDPVIKHEALIERTKLALLTPFDLQHPDIAMWLAEKVGANTVVFGTIDTAADDNWGLRVRVVRLSDDKLLAEYAGSLAVKTEWLALRDKPLPSVEKPRLAAGCDLSAADKAKRAFDAAGVTPPRCGHCPDPPYSDEARRRKLQGTIAVKCIIDEAGRVIPVQFPESRPPELADPELVDNVLKAYRSWKLEPARKNGDPVAVCIWIESSFSLF
jgi:TonB family protein